MVIGYETQVLAAGQTGDLAAAKLLRLPRLVLSRRVRFTDRFTKQAIDLQFPIPFPPFRGCHPWMRLDCCCHPFGRSCQSISVIDMVQALAVKRPLPG